MNTSIDRSSSLRPELRYKSIMNIIRRAFSFRSRQDIRDDLDHKSSNSINTSISSSNHTQSSQSSPSPLSSDVASTSRDSLPVVDAMSVYEDPFVAVTSDGNLYVKFYYEFNPRVEFRFGDIHHPFVRKSSRVIKISRLRDMSFATHYDLNNNETCKSWGITRNDVWWASHANRQNSVTGFGCVVVNDGMSMRAGFSVIRPDAFVTSLRILGLPADCSFNHGLPSPPIDRCQIPFIDEDTEPTADDSYML